MCGNGFACCARGDLHAYHHASPQSFCLLAGLAGSPHLAVDWVGRVEAFEQDFGELLAQLNARPGVPQLPLLPPPERANVAQEACFEAGAQTGSSSSSSSSGGDDGSPIDGGGSGREGSVGLFRNSSAADWVQRFNASTWQMLHDLENSTKPSPLHSQLDVFYPCDKQSFYSGPFGSCASTLADFYADDMRLLHGGEGVAAAAAAAAAPPAAADKASV